MECYSTKGLDRLSFVQNTVRQNKYPKVLENKLLRQLDKWYLNGNSVSLQDSSCDTASSENMYFSENCVEMLLWPANSPDNNKLEGIWNDIQNKENKTIITNRTQLIKCLVIASHHNP